MMKRRVRVFGIITLSIIAIVGINLAQKPAAAPATAPQRAAARPAVATANPAVTGMSTEAQQALVKQYCSGCHSEKLKSGNMTLTDLDLAHPEKNPELAERVIRKLRVGLMPPVGSPRPDAETMKSF